MSVSAWLDLKTSVYRLVHKFITRKNSLTNQALSLLGEESPIFWISERVHIDWYKKMNLMSHSILNANLLFVPLFVRMIDINI